MLTLSVIVRVDKDSGCGNLGYDGHNLEILNRGHLQMQADS
jgi:hypothetical protein